MYASVEARVPFLDHELVEFCYKKIPYSLKIKWNSKEEKELDEIGTEDDLFGENSLE